MGSGIVSRNSLLGPGSSLVDRFFDHVLLGKIVDAEHVLFLPTGLWRYLSGLGAKASKLLK